MIKYNLDECRHLIFLTTYHTESNITGRGYFKAKHKTNITTSKSSLHGNVGDFQ